MTDDEVAAALGQAKPASGGMTDDQVFAAMQPPQAKPAAPHKPEGFIERLKAGAQGLSDTIKGTATAIGQTVAHPIDTFTNEHRRRELLRGIDDAVGFGGLRRIADPVGQAIQNTRIGQFIDEHTGGHGETGDQPLAQTEQADAAQAPGFRAAGTVAGMFLPGGSKIVGKNAGGAAEELLGGVSRKASGFLPGAAIGGAKALAGYELSAPVIAGAQAATHGDNPIIAAREAATDPLGLILAGTGGAVTGGARGASNKLRDTKTQTGQVVRDVEAAGGKIRPFGNPAAGGLYEAPELQDLPQGREGVNKLAQNSQERIVAHNRNKLAQAREHYNQEFERILADHQEGGPGAPSETAPERQTMRLSRTQAGAGIGLEDTMVDGRGPVEEPHVRPPSPEEAAYADRRLRGTVKLDRPPSADELRAEMAKTIDESLPPAEPTAPGKPRLYPAHNTESILNDMEARSKLSSGKVADPELNKFVEKMRDLISTDTDQIDVPHLQATGEARVLRKPEIPVGDLVKLKKLVTDKAEWGRPSTVDNAPYRLISKAIAQDAEAIDPRIAELNRQYGSTMEDLKSANQILFGAHKSDISEAQARGKGAALKLGRAGDNTQAATTDKLDQLEKLDPEYARELRLLRAKKAAERIRYGEPQTSSAIEQGMHRAAGHGARKVIGAALGAAHGPVGMVAGAALADRLSNPMALKLRLGLPVADLAGRATGFAPGTYADMLARAREAELMREQERASALGAP